MNNILNIMKLRLFFSIILFIRNYDVIIALPFDARSKNTKEKRVVSSNTTLFIVPLPTANKDEAASSDE